MCRVTIIVFLAVLTLSVRSTDLRAGVVFDAATDFSATSNPTGVWSYGQSATLGSLFHFYTQSGPDNADSPPANLLDTWNGGTSGVFAVPAVYHNGTSGIVSFNGGTITFQPGELGFHPGPLGQFSVVRFTAPFTGTYDLVSFYRPLDVHTTTDVHVLLNDVSIFDGLVNPGLPASFAANLTLIAGDRLDFAVGVGLNGNFSNDSTGLSASLTTAAVPEPSTLVMLSIVLAIFGVTWSCQRLKRSAAVA